MLRFCAAILFLIISALPLDGQDLLRSTHSAEWSYIYQVSNEEAVRIFRSKTAISSPDAFLHTLIDSFPSQESYASPLPPGHYLRVSIQDNRLKTEMTSVPNCEIHTLNNDADLKLQVFDLQGHILPGLQVKMKEKTIRFDPETQSYRQKNSNARGLVLVEYDGLTNVFDLKRERNNPKFMRTLYQLGYRSPAQYIWRPVRFVVGIPVDGVRSMVQRRLRGTWYKIRRLLGFRYRDRQLQGYLVTNQPKYRPGDTLHYKAFVLDAKRHRPYRKPLVLRFGGQYLGAIADTVQPYRPGAYQGHIVLTNKLAPTLDRAYYLLLQNEKGNREISRVVMLEDYELKGTTFSLSSAAKSHHRGGAMVLKASATDENNLRLGDARIDLVVRRGRTLKYFADHVTIPDVLWETSLDLDPKTDTRIVLPDSIFPAASFTYEVTGTFHTSDNETDEKSLSLKYTHDLPELSFEAVSDSLRLKFTRNGQEESQNAVLYGYSATGKAIVSKLVRTPVAVPINAYCASYAAESEEVEVRFVLAEDQAGITCSFQRNRDSLKVEVINPHKLPFAWHLYRTDRELDAGYGRQFSLKKRVRNKDNYYLAVQFLWGGSFITQNYAFPIRDKQVDLELEVPPLVYPGQTVDLSIKATDHAGKPVGNLDLVAYGLTAKFKEYQPPVLPNLNHRALARLSQNKFSIHHPQQHQLPPSSRLNYPRWNKRARLDRDEYYQFLYPDSGIFRKNFPVVDSNSQFSPFVVHDGEILAVQVVYLDNRPVYFNWNSKPAPYAFAAKPGYHQVTLRLSNALVQMDSVKFEAGTRHLFSLDDRYPHALVRVTPMENSLTEAEKSYLYPYIFAYTNFFNPWFAALRQGDHLAQLNDPNTPAGRCLSGPFAPGFLMLRMTDSTELKFVYENGYAYSFGPGLLKMKELKPGQLPTTLGYPARRELADTVLTEAGFNRRWREYLNLKRLSTNRFWYNQLYRTSPDRGSLALHLNDSTELGLRILNSLIVSETDPDMLRVYAGQEKSFYQLRPGTYTVIYLLADDQYVAIRHLQVKADMENFYRRDPGALQHDLFGGEFARAIEKWVIKDGADWNPPQEQEDYKTIYHRHFSKSPGGEVLGRVIDQDDNPIEFAKVLAMSEDNRILGGSTTDTNGEFSLQVPKGATQLKVSFPGRTQGVILGDRKFVEVVLDFSMELESVKIIEKLELQRMSSSVNAVSLSSISGVQRPTIDIRGGRAEEQLVFIDGIKVITGGIPGEYGDLAGGIASIERMDAAKAVALFGEEGRNGAIIITTAAAGEAWSGLDGAKPLRSNFRDYAFWLPRLKTDAHGVAKAKVQLPDDVTSWKAYVLGMDGKKHFGSGAAVIKSYKPLMARLELPRFLLSGDTTHAIGKVLNYGGDTVRVRTQFRWDSDLVQEKTTEVDASLVDTLILSMGGRNRDSLDVQFSLTREGDGYRDGELRQIPIYRRGVLETLGQFLRLDGDTSLSLSFDPASGPVTVHAEANPLKVLLNETEHLRGYRYQCNEQLASRLIGLLCQKSIREQLGEPFKWNQEVKKTMKLLRERMADDGTWGWWPGNPRDGWVSLQVVRAMNLADSLGFPSGINWEKYHPAWVQMLGRSERPDIGLVQALAETGAAADYARFILFLEEKRLDLTEKIKLIGLRQMARLDFQLDSLLAWQKSTAFGNLHWGEGWDAMPATLEAYRVLRAAGGHEEELERIRGYFLEQRRDGHWLNTWQSARVLHEILPDLLQAGTLEEMPRLQLAGATEQSVTEFPFGTEFQPGQTLQVEKSGKLPVYFTAYQRKWNENPEPGGNIFSVASWFELPDTSSRYLKAGSEVELVIRVEVKQDAEYVMVEAPIPAGCTYASKPQPWGREVHREYFREQCAIFCRELKTGVHVFRVPLLPQFSGSYTLNPAKAEMMYFPSFFGRNASKRVRVGR